jgi:diguanylate cyclase (GGDEF)-like protein
MSQNLSFTANRGGTFAFGLCIVVLLWISVGYKYETDMLAARTDAERENNNLSMLLEENALRAVEEIDKSLLYMRRFIETKPDQQSLSSIINASDLVSEIIVQVAVIDADGIMIASSASSPGDLPIGKIDLSDRPHFLFHKHNTADVLYISPPVVGRASGKWSVQFTRRLQTATGAFAGVVVASLDPRHLTSFYDSMNYGSSTSIALIGDDGIVRSSGGNQTGVLLGADISKQEFFIRAKAQGDATFSYVDPNTHQQMLTTFRPLRDRSMWLEISRNLEEDFAEPAQTLVRNSIVAALVSILIIYVTIGIFLSEQRVRNKARQLRSTLDNMTEGIMLIAPDDAVQVLNETCCRLLGFPTEMVETPGQVEGGALRCIIATARTGEPDGGAVSGDRRALFERVMPDGKVLEVRSNTLADRGIVCTVADITDRRQSEDRIMRLASEDALTGLPNRRSFLGAIKTMLDRAGDTQVGGVDEFAVLFLDVDHFKNINDSLGHRVGDLLLYEIGKRMRALLPEKAIVARLGGDEFALLLPSIGSTAEIEAFAGLIITSFAMPFDVDGYQISASVSIGISIGPTDAADVDALLAAADLALYSTKSERRGMYRFYAPSMTEGLEERRWIESALAASIEAQELEMHYQPIMDLKTGSLTGFEALARWTHPERGPITPDKFIPVAEESGARCNGRIR